MKVGKTIPVLQCLLLCLGLAPSVEGQFASFSPTDDAKMHGIIIDAVSGQPVPGTAVRILGEPELLTFTAADVNALSPKTRLFLDSPVIFTGPQGRFTLDSPIDFPSFYLAGIMANESGFLLAAAPAANPLATPIGFAYTRIEITNRYLVVNGKIHAGYLPTLAVVPSDKESEGAKVVASVNQLTVTAKPPVVLKGNPVDLHIRWQYVAMPLMDSQVVFAEESTADGHAVELVKRSGEGGRVVEQWKVTGYPLGDETGMQSIALLAHLDGPYNTSAAAMAKGHVYVAATQAEADAYQQVHEAQKLPADQSAQAIGICRATIRKFPEMTNAWVELVRRQEAAKNWAEVRDTGEKAPVAAKQAFAVAGALAASYEQLGAKEKRWESLIAVAASTDAPAAARQLCFAEALKEKQYDVAKKIVPHLNGIGLMGRASIVRYLAWMSGERDVANEQRVWMAEALAANEEPTEALVVLADIDLEALDSDYKREEYYEFLVKFHLDQGDLRRAEEALLSIAKLKNKSVDELDDHLLLGRVAEAKGDLASALRHYEEGLGGIDTHVEAFERALLKSLQADPNADAASYAATALSLLAAHRFKKAGELAAEAVHRDAKLAAAHLTLGLAEQMTGNLSEAASRLQQARRLVPGSQYLAIEYQRARDLARMNKPHAHVFRIWTDHRGRVAEAALLEVEQGQVLLQARNDKTFRIKADMLSERDRRFLGLTDGDDGSN